MLRIPTKAASPSLPAIRISAWLHVTITYCSGFPMVAATIVLREPRRFFRFSSERVIVVSSFRSGMIKLYYQLPISCQQKMIRKSLTLPAAFAYILAVNYRAMITGARASPTGANTSTTGVSVMKPPKRALFPCPRHSAREARQPVVKSSEQPQADNRIHFIFNAWYRFNIADFWQRPNRPPPPQNDFIILVRVVSG